MAQIARFTTPAFVYKPSAVEISSIDKIFLVLSQCDIKITKDISQATVNEEGFAWILTQEETQQLVTAGQGVAQVDYLTADGLRYTTVPVMFEITNSAVCEVV